MIKRSGSSSVRLCLRSLSSLSSSIDIRERLAHPSLPSLPSLLPVQEKETTPPNKAQKLNPPSNNSWRSESLRRSRDASLPLNPFSFRLTPLFPSSSPLPPTSSLHFERYNLDAQLAPHNSGMLIVKLDARKGGGRRGSLLVHDLEKREGNACGVM